MAEKLAALNLPAGETAGAEGEEGQATADVVVPPSADSVHVLLKQALRADDRAALLGCLYNRDDKVIVKSISLLTPAMPPDDILEEIFLRLPPDKPAWLVRASLTSKHWLHILTGARFRGRYREFHGGPPPTLGYFYSMHFPLWHDAQNPTQAFLPTTKFRPRLPNTGSWRPWRYAPLDCRHGRLLLGVDLENGEQPVQPGVLIVWDPITGFHTELDEPDGNYCRACRGAAVLCAVSGCDHRACRHDGPFMVIFVALASRYDSTACAWKFSSEIREWSQLCTGPNLEACALVERVPPVLIKDALYFLYSYNGNDTVGILKYDMASNCLSLIDPPGSGFADVGKAILMVMENGTLWLAVCEPGPATDLVIDLWSWQMGSDRVPSSWTRRGVINLVNLLPNLKPKATWFLNGYVESSDVIFVSTGLHVYEINVKSLH